MKNLRIAYLASGAAGMYCGSCLRDNRLAATLIEQGRDVVLMPLYTPLRTDERDVSMAPVHYGGVNVFLQQTSAVFRHLPRAIGRLLDSPALLNFLSRRASAVDAKSLGAMTVSVLKGENGAQARELEKLLSALSYLKPNIVHLPMLPFLGVAERIKKTLDVPLFCTLGGEDIFLDELTEPHRTHAFDLIEKHSRHVDAFVATTRYYAQHCIDHFRLPADRIHHVPMGIRAEDFESDAGKPDGGELTIGYLARMCPEKGLADLCEAFVLLRRAGRECSLKVAGYLAPTQEQFVKGLRDYLGQPATAGHFEFLGEVSRASKIQFLQSLDIFCVPSVYREAKGLYVLEAMACGVPVVEPAHGSFPELIEETGGGLTYDPATGPKGLADTISQLMDDVQQRKALGLCGKEAVREKFTDRNMANRMWELYEQHANK